VNGESTAQLTNSAYTAAAICARFNLKREARKLLRDGMGPHEFVHALMADKQYVSAIDFMAYALAAREGVWWGCLCLQYACGTSLSPEEKIGCRAAVQWVMDASEENRVAAQAPAQQAGLKSPAGQLAMAATQTSLGLDPAPVPASRAVAAAVKMTSIKADPELVSDTQRLFVELGLTWLKPDATES
jgi:hypothetical protein